MNDAPRSGVVRFLQQARDIAGGSVPQLADAIAPALGHRPSDKTVRSWLRGDRRPDGQALMAMVATLHDRGLSFDQVALDGSDQRPLVEQLDELRRRVVRLEFEYDADRANRGLPPVDQVSAAS